jgi:4-methyl-5(b-hydroxyethyl)-thiazole monophosphate biosynthesis
MKKEVLVPVADGTEEMEAVTIIDVLRRAGANVTVASVDGGVITASRGVKLAADCLMADCRRMRYDLIALPGGMPGAEHLRDHPLLAELLDHQAREERWLGAICAAPAVVLAHHGLLQGRKATCHPAFVDRLPDRSAVDCRVVVDGHLITSRGPGTALEFALRLVVALYGRDHAEKVALPMVPLAGTL